MGSSLGYLLVTVLSCVNACSGLEGCTVTMGTVALGRKVSSRESLAGGSEEATLDWMCSFRLFIQIALRPGYLRCSHISVRRSL